MSLNIRITENQTIGLIIFSYLASLFFYALPAITESPGISLILLTIALILCIIFSGLDNGNIGKIFEFFLCCCMFSSGMGLAAFSFIQEKGFFFAPIIYIIFGIFGVFLLLLEREICGLIFGGVNNIPM